MQKTTVLYITAVATLAGAFLLTPKDASPPPEPVFVPPAPTVEGPASITRLTFDDGRVSVDARISHGMFSDLHSAPLYMDAAVTARDRGEAADLALVLVIDRSGSMAGAKIDDARLAAQGMIKRLKATDQVAVVSYGTDVTVDLPLTTANRANKSRALRAVDLLEEGGGTNIDGALRATAALLNRAKVNGRAARVILVSDGRPTEGARSQTALSRHATSLKASGAVLSTIGVGLDYNEDLMERLANAGTGRYHYLKRSRMLTKILGDEMQHATRAAARNVTVTLPRAFQGFRVAAAQGRDVLTQLDNASAHDVRIDLGDLAAGETRHVVLRLERTPNAGKQVTLSAPRIEYSTVASGERKQLLHLSSAFRVNMTDDLQAVTASERPEVMAQAFRIQSSIALRDSVSAYAKGDMDNAQRIVQDKANRVRAFAERTNNKDALKAAVQLDNAATKMKAQAPATSGGRDLIKAQKADAYWLSH